MTVKVIFIVFSAVRLQLLISALFSPFKVRLVIFAKFTIKLSTAYRETTSLLASAVLKKVLFRFEIKAMPPNYSCNLTHGH